MYLKTLQYVPDKGWSEPLPVEMDSSQTAVIFFAAAKNQRVKTAVQEISAAFPNSHIAGCSTAGEIFQATVSDYSISLAVMKFEKTQVSSACTNFAGIDDIENCCEDLARGLYKDDLKCLFLLSEGININATRVLEGISRVTSDKVIVTGGLAGDGAEFDSTWVYDTVSCSSDTLCALAFYGDAIQVGHGSKGGWDIFGPDRLVTKSTHNILYELDGQPALALYKKYLGDRASGLPATGLLFPLAINNSLDHRKNEVVRTILSIDEEAQSITFAGDIPEGYYARLMRANIDRLIDGAASAANSVICTCTDSANCLAISISCVGRKLVLGERTEEEIEAALYTLPENTQQIGFYSYGEISPLASGQCDLHNQTMTITTFSEH